LAASAEALEAPVLELDRGCVSPVRNETQLDLGLQVGVVLPVGSDVPREHQPRVRLPREDAAPLTRAPILASFVPAPAHPGLEDSVHGCGLTDLVALQRPPCAHLLSEHAPGHRLRSPDPHHLAYAVGIEPAGDLFRHGTP